MAKGGGGPVKEARGRAQPIFLLSRCGSACLETATVLEKMSERGKTAVVLLGNFLFSSNFALLALFSEAASASEGPYPPLMVGHVAKMCQRNHANQIQFESFFQVPMFWENGHLSFHQRNG